MNRFFHVIFISFFFQAGAQQINFEQGSWEEIKAKARHENKLIFMDAYTTWCGPCKAMAKNVFTNREVAEFYNSTFINVKMDMEKGEGLELAKTYDVRCYPTLLYINRDGELVHRAAGAKSPDDFIQLGKVPQAQEQTYSAMQKKYKEGNREAPFVKEYISVLSANCFPSNEPAVNYLKGLKQEKLLGADNWSIFQEHVTDTESEPFVYFIRNKSSFSSKFGDSTVSDKIYGSFLNHAYELLGQRVIDEAAVGRLRNNVQQLDYKRKKELTLTIDEIYFETRKDWDNYFVTTKKMVDQFRMNNSDYLNNVSYVLYENSTNKKHLAEAEKWAKRSVELGESFYNLDTYACLLNKNGKKKEAIETQKKAISLAKANGQDTSDLEKTLKSFGG